MHSNMMLGGVMSMISAIHFSSNVANLWGGVRNQTKMVVESVKNLEC